MITRIHKGQAYTSLETIPHICRDGREVRLTRWKSDCAECCQPFVFAYPTHAPKFAPNRRCSVHRRPGAIVRAAP